MIKIKHEHFNFAETTSNTETRTRSWRRTTGTSRGGTTRTPARTPSCCPQNSWRRRWSPAASTSTRSLTNSTVLMVSLLFGTSLSQKAKCQVVWVQSSENKQRCLSCWEIWSHLGGRWWGKDSVAQRWKITHSFVLCFVQKANSSLTRPTATSCRTKASTRERTRTRLHPVTGPSSPCRWTKAARDCSCSVPSTSGTARTCSTCPSWSKWRASAPRITSAPLVPGSSTEATWTTSPTTCLLGGCSCYFSWFSSVVDLVSFCICTGKQEAKFPSWGSSDRILFLSNNWGTWWNETWEQCFFFRAINAENGEANNIRNIFTGEFGAVPETARDYKVRSYEILHH